MQAKSIKVELPDDLYRKVGTVTSEHFETTGEYIKKVISDSIREELELKDIKRQNGLRYTKKRYWNHLRKRMMLQRG